MSRQTTEAERVLIDKAVDSLKALDSLAPLGDDLKHAEAFFGTSICFRLRALRDAIRAVKSERDEGRRYSTMANVVYFDGEFKCTCCDEIFASVVARILNKDLAKYGN